MSSDHDAIQTISFDVAGVVPAYTLHEADSDSGFDESFKLMIHLRSPKPTKGSVQHGVVQIKASREMQSATLTRIDDESSPGIGLVTSTPEGIIVQTILPFDAAWNIVHAAGVGFFSTAVVHCDPFDADTDRAFLRGLEFKAA